MPTKKSPDRLRFLRFDHRSYFAKKQLLRFSALLAGIWIVHTFLLSDQSAITLFQLETGNSALERDIARTEATLDSLRRMASLLESDPGTIERVARERYHMIGKDEMQYVFIEVPEKDRERLIREVREQQAADEARAAAEDAGDTGGSLPH